MKVSLEKFDARKYSNSGFQEAFVSSLNKKFFDKSSLPKYKNLRLFDTINSNHVVISRNPLDIYNMSMYKSLPKRCFTVSRKGYENSKKKHINEVRNGTIILFLIDGIVPKTSMKDTMLPNVVARLKIQSFINVDTGTVLFSINKCGSGKLSSDFIKYANKLVKDLNKSSAVSGYVYSLPRDMDKEATGTSMYVNDLDSFHTYIDKYLSKVPLDYPEIGPDIRIPTMIGILDTLHRNSRITDRQYVNLVVSVLHNADIGNNNLKDLVIRKFILTGNSNQNLAIQRLAIVNNPYVSSDIIDTLIRTTNSFDLLISALRTGKASTKLLKSIQDEIDSGIVPLSSINKKINARLYVNLYSMISDILGDK